MKLHRFIGDYDFSKSEVEIIDPQIIKQIKAVLRLEKGELIILSDGKGNNAEVSITSLSLNKIVGTINKVDKKIKSKRKVFLYLAVLKKENFEIAVQKAVEAGVSEIIPVITERTIKTGLNIERLKKIILEASEQSGRSFVPTLSPILNFKDAIEKGKDAEEKIIFTPPCVENKDHRENEFYTPNKEAENISIFIGPEGGFANKEIKEAMNAGYITASLGHLTLRAETAALIATYRATKGV